MVSASDNYYMRTKINSPNHNTSEHFQMYNITHVGRRGIVDYTLLKDTN